MCVLCVCVKVDDDDMFAPERHPPHTRTARAQRLQRHTAAGTAVVIWCFGLCVCLCVLSCVLVTCFSFNSYSDLFLLWIHPVSFSQHRRRRWCTSSTCAPPPVFFGCLVSFRKPGEISMLRSTAMKCAGCPVRLLDSDFEFPIIGLNRGRTLAHSHSM